jgi:hypothetical protein
LEKHNIPASVRGFGDDALAIERTYLFTELGLRHLRVIDRSNNSGRPYRRTKFGCDGLGNLLVSRPAFKVGPTTADHPMIDVIIERRGLV